MRTKAKSEAPDRSRGPHIAMCGHWCLCSAPSQHDSVKKGACINCQKRKKQK